MEGRALLRVSLALRREVEIFGGKRSCGHLPGLLLRWSLFTYEDRKVRPANGGLLENAVRLLVRRARQDGSLKGHGAAARNDGVLDTNLLSDPSTRQRAFEDARLGCQNPSTPQSG